MGDHERGPVRHHVLERVLDERLRLRVEMGGGLVEDQDLGVLEDDPGDRDALLLSSRQPVSALADDRVVTARHRGDHVVDVGSCGSLQLLVGGLRTRIPEIRGD